MIDNTHLLLFLGLIFMVNGTIANIIVAALASRLAGQLRGRFGERMQKATAFVFIGLGLRLAFAKAPA